MLSEVIIKNLENTNKSFIFFFFILSASDTLIKTEKHKYNLKNFFHKLNGKLINKRIKNKKLIISNDNHYLLTC